MIYSYDYDVVIGIVLTPHGTGGLVKVYPYSDFPDRAQLLKNVELLKGTRSQICSVEKASVHGKYWLIKFRGIETREEAEEIRDSMIRIPREERIPLPEGSYYHDQLEGLQVYDPSGNLLGTVIKLIPGGGHDQIVIARAGEKNKTNYIPAVKDFIKQVNLTEGALVVELPEGLLDL